MKKHIIIMLALVTVITAVGTTFVGCGHDENGAVKKEEQESGGKSTKEAEWIELTEEEYSTLLKGGLSKELTEKMLAIGPTHLEEGQIDQAQEGEMVSSLQEMLETGNDTSVFELAGISTEYVNEGGYMEKAPLDAVNQLFSFYQEDAYTNVAWAKMDAGELYFSLVTPSRHSKVQIASAKYREDDMEISYIKTMKRYDGKESIYSCKAHLKKQEDGLFQVKTIETEDIEGLYQAKIDEVKAGNYPSETLVMDEYDQDEAEGNAEYGKYGYAYYDINGDGIDDLLLRLNMPYSRIIAYVSTNDGGIALVYDEENYCEKSFFDGVALVGGSRTSLSILKDGTGLLDVSWSSGTGQEDADCIRIDGEGECHIEKIYADVFMDDAPRELLPPTKEIEWTDL